MQTSLYNVTIPVFIRSLTALRAILDKAEAHVGESADALLEKRLAPDQFPFVRQIQIACDNAKVYVFRLNGEEPPSFPDTETTMAELKARIDATLSILANITPERVNGHEESPVRLKYFAGKKFSGLDYTTEYILPNFFFHVTTAYAILRHEGVPLGKNDYIGGLSLEEDN